MIPQKDADDKTSLLGNFSQQTNQYIGGLQLFWQEFFNRAGKPVDTLYDVARQRLAQGEYKDAAQRFRLVVKFRKDHAEAWYGLGSAELGQGNTQKAVEAFRETLRFSPQHEEARFLLTVAAPEMVPLEQQPKYSPLTLATTHFDMLAYGFDEEQLDVLGYHGHEELFNSVRKYLNPEYKGFHIIDLGCGTGLAGLLFRDIAGKIEGVDISRNMLMQAEVRRTSNERSVYDALHQADLRRFLVDQPPASVEIVLAANVFPYVGGLTPIFDGAAHILKPGGLLAFSVEPVEGSDFQMLPGEGRFGHSEAYILAQAKRVGLDVVEARPIELYADYEGMQYVMRKPMPQPAPQPSPEPYGAPGA